FHGAISIPEFYDYSGESWLVCILDAVSVVILPYPVTNLNRCRFGEEFNFTHTVGFTPVNVTCPGEDSSFSGAGTTTGHGTSACIILRIITRTCRSSRVPVVYKTVTVVQSFDTAGIELIGRVHGCHDQLIGTGE